MPEPTYPSAQELQTWLDKLTQQAVSEEEAAQRFTQSYWESSAEDCQKDVTQFTQASLASRQHLSEQLAAYEARMGGASVAPLA